MKSQLVQVFPDIKEHHELASYCTFRIGGQARYFLVVKKREDLQKALRIAKEEGINHFILGGGSNVLISSLGFDGLVIKNEMNHIEVHENKITAESGVILAVLVKTAKDHGLQGIAALQGVPGTVGGAVRGNAGVPNCEMGDYVVSSVLLDEHLEFKTVDRAYFDYSYRYSKLKKNKEIIIETTFVFTPGGDPKEIQKDMMDMLKARKAKQPWGSSGGSYFKNPSKKYSAGYLSDHIGGKGLSVGGAQISEKHANFFLNKGNATSEDVLQLAEKIKRKVLLQYGILMEEEVEYVGKRPWKYYIQNQPLVKALVIIGLVIIGIIGLILPVMPGLIFLVLAIYIFSPKAAEKVVAWYHKKVREIGVTDVLKEEVESEKKE